MYTYANCLMSSEVVVRQFRHLPIELFDIGVAKYVFDVKNVVFVEVEDPIFSILGILRDEDLDLDGLTERLAERFTRADVELAMEAIINFQSKGVLVSYPFVRRHAYSNNEIERTLTTKLGTLTLFVTTRCNLACSYCVFGGEYDKHGKLNHESMSWDTAKNAIDFMIENGKEAGKLRLDFFGGEPLLSFELVKKSLEYLEASHHGPTVATVVTNGTLLTDAMLDFFIEHAVHLQFSIDLDQQSHDLNRKFKNSGHPSYQLVTTNLQRIKETNVDYFRQYIHIKTVVTPESVNKINDMDIHPLVRELSDIKKLSPLMKEPHYNMELDKEYFEAIDQLGDKLLEIRGVSTIDQLLENLNFKQKLLYYKTFGRMLSAQVINRVLQGGLDQVPFAKGCTPGSEAAVDVNGNLSICHKSGSFVIGNVNGKGWNFEAIRHYDAMHHTEWPRCKGCFVQRFCELCYEKMHAANWEASRHSYCTFNQNLYRLVFDRMLRVFHQNPDLWPEVGRICREVRERQLKQNESRQHSSLDLAQV